MTFYKYILNGINGKCTQENDKGLCIASKKNQKTKKSKEFKELRFFPHPDTYHPLLSNHLLYSHWETGVYLTFGECVLNMLKYTFLYLSNVRILTGIFT